MDLCATCSRDFVGRALPYSQWRARAAFAASPMRRLMQLLVPMCSNTLHTHVTTACFARQFTFTQTLLVPPAFRCYRCVSSRSFCRAASRAAALLCCAALFVFLYGLNAFTHIRAE